MIWMRRTVPTISGKLLPLVVLGILVVTVLDISLCGHNKGETQAKAPQSESPLWDAVTNGDIQRAKALIAAGADVNYKNRYGASVLHQAVSRGHAELVELLLAKGANVNAKARFDVMPLHLAGKDGIAEILLAHGAEVDAQTDKGETALHWAAGGGIGTKGEEAMLRMAAVLLRHEADVNKMSSAYGTPLTKAAYANKILMAKLLIARGADVEGKGASPLCATGNSGSVEMAKLLIKHGAGVNTRARNGSYPLHCAAYHGQLAMFLLSSGANPNALTDQGFTALYLAAQSDVGAASAEALLTHGADPNAKNTYGRTALHQAALQGATKVIAILLAFKADINAGDKEGYTPLYGAILRGQLGAVEMLVTNGADVNATNDRDGETPLHKAISGGYLAIVKLLISYGADVNAVSKLGVTSLVFARNSKAITELLQKQGAE